MKKITEIIRDVIKFLRNFRINFLIARYKLKGKVEVLEIQDGLLLEWILFPIIKESANRTQYLPENFIKQFKKIAKRKRKSWERQMGKNATFCLSVKTEGVTKEELERDIKSWIGYCELFWVAFC